MMIAVISIALSVVALGFSFFVFLDNRRKDQRDIFLQIHQLLISDDLQRGRYLLFEKVVDEASVEHLNEDEWRDINRAIATYNTLGFYLANGYVKQRDVMDVWARHIWRTWKAAQPYLTYHERLQGYRPWRYFTSLAETVQQELLHRGDSIEVQIWRREEGTSPGVARSGMDDS